ncbi:recombinase family protein [Propionibacterium freudenreichii]|uniref:recombinase family protein n=1 Tax=Propionibacterium freudenreichii TaxID=1744 RepID=UPI0005426423|nr:recombinase family protein [Propionibacterium freudenreichii]CEG94919.1 Integrase [Propionibacterium freudenreichii]
MSERAALYCRVSTQEQVEHGTSLREQQRRLEAYAKQQGWTIQGIYADAGISGARLDRPEYVRMMTAVEEGEVDIILAADGDRLTRLSGGLSRLFDDLDPLGVNVVTLDGVDSRTDAGELSGGILSIVSGAERKRIKARTMRGRMAAAREGRFVATTPPFGYRRTRLTTGGWTLVEHEPEARTIRYLVKRLVEEGATHTVVLAELKTRRLAAPGGPGWDLEKLMRFMRRRDVPMRCAGKHSFNGIEQEFPALISQGQAALWLEWQTERARPQTERGSYLLSGILKFPCGGGAMGRQVKHLREGRKNQPATYCCRQHFISKADPRYHPDCLSVYLEPVDAAVKNAIRARLQQALEQRRDQLVPVELDLGDLAERREEALRRLEATTSSLAAAGISGEAFVRSIAPIKQQYDAVEAEIAERQRQHARASRSVDAETTLALAKNAMLRDDRDTWRELLMALHVEVRITGYESCPECDGTGYQPAAGRPRGWPPPCERCRRAKLLPHLVVTMDDVAAAQVMRALR